jgi:hypothetical protein
MWRRENSWPYQDLNCSLQSFSPRGQSSSPKSRGNIYCHTIVTIDGVWIGNQIYWTLKQLVTTFYKSVSHRLVFSVTTSTALLGSSFQQQTFHLLWVPKLSPASATSFSVPTTATPNWLSACRLSLNPSLDSRFGLYSDWLVMAAGPRYIASAWTA